MKRPETVAEKQWRLRVEADCANIARHAAETTIKPLLPPGTGFALLVFDMGDGGCMTYASNATRESMVKALRELADNLERNPAPEKGKRQ